MRRSTSLLISGIIAVSAVCSQLIPSFTASAYETPTDIRLSIETKELAINEIPNDRIVTLDIYTENCPPYNALIFLLEKDSRLEYQPFHYLTGNREIENMVGLSFTLGSDECPDFISCTVPAWRNKLIDFNGRVARANLILPDDVSPGDFYHLSFLRTFTDRNDYETRIMFENSFDASFGNECFSELNNGGILITEAREAVLGDVDGNGTVDSSDASLVLAEYALLLTGKESAFTPRQRESADTNKDGVIDSSDASKIIRYYADSSTGKAPTWD